MRMGIRKAMDDKIHNKRELERLLNSYEALDDKKLLDLLGQKALGLSDGDLTRNGDKSEIFELGNRILRRWSRSLHSMLCGSAEEDSEFRIRFINAVSGKQALAPIIAGIAATAFGLSAAMAALLGTLIARYFIDPAADEICKSWGKSLS